MTSSKPTRSAFTLIEVMVAVMIISVVIAALIQMNGNSSAIFQKVKKDSGIGQYSSFLIGAKNYGFEDSRITLDKLTQNFTFTYDSQLRLQLRNEKANIIYTELDSIDMSEFDADKSTLDDIQETDKEKKVNSSLVFEIGRSTLKLNGSSTSLIRLRLQ